MSYRKIKKVPVQGNTERCKVLRCLWAKKLFSLLESGHKVINIDETWIPETDFRKYKWSKKGEQNTYPERVIGHRANLIVALSNDGEVYASITQCNTDADVYMMFLSRLASVLTKESPGWREKTVFTMDGAAYHKASRDIFKHLGLKVAISAPYR